MKKIESNVQIDRKYNKSTTFVRPMLGYPVEFYSIVSFYDTYITTVPDRIHLVFKQPLDDLTAGHTIPELRSNINFIEKINFRSHILMSFKIPKLFTNDFYYFLEGKYSKLSSFYKGEVIKSHMFLGSDYTNNIEQILYPSDIKRKLLEVKLDIELHKDAEIFDRMSWEEELLDINKFI